MDVFHRFKAEVYRKLHLALQHYAPNAPEAVKAREIAANECNAMWIKLISADSGCEEEVRSERSVNARPSRRAQRMEGRALTVAFTVMKLAEAGFESVPMSLLTAGAIFGAEGLSSLPTNERVLLVGSLALSCISISYGTFGICVGSDRNLALGNTRPERSFGRMGKMYLAFLIKATCGVVSVGAAISVRSLPGAFGWLAGGFISTATFVLGTIVTCASLLLHPGALDRAYLVGCLHFYLFCVVGCLLAVVAEPGIMACGIFDADYPGLSIDISRQSSLGSRYIFKATGVPAIYNWFRTVSACSSPPAEMACTCCPA